MFDFLASSCAATALPFAWCFMAIALIVGLHLFTPGSDLGHQGGKVQ